MTDKEILEYSKQIIDAKTEIENSEATEPDIEDQIRNKFSEDSINRARFIDSTVIIGGATKEFRNVFGVDAPHYELNKDCYFAIDKNNNNEYDMDEKNDERVPVDDPMNDNQRSKTFVDCWDMINAAKFDSTSTIKDFEGGSTKPPVERQRFFVDSKKADKGSPAHNPICPPGYDHWAGSAVYSYICKNFDLTEPIIYKILSAPSNNTIPRSFILGPFDGNNTFDYNIDESGKITKNNFVYNYTNDSNMFKAYNDPQFRLQKDGCSPADEHPIKWFEITIPVTSIKQNGKYYYNYDWTGTPFEISRTPISSFRIVTAKREQLNEGYSIFCLDLSQLNSLQYSGKSYKSSQNIRFCVHIIYKKTNKLDNGKNETQNRKFLWWSWSKEIKHRYNVYFEPISGNLPNGVKEKFASFVRNMEDDCLFYYNLASEREVETDIPDLNESFSKMQTLRNAANSFIKTSSVLPVLKLNRWNDFINALRDRVAYDIYKNVEDFSSSSDINYFPGDVVLYSTNPNNLKDLYYCKTRTTGGTFNSSEWSKVFSVTTSVTTGETEIQYMGKTTYITKWESKYVPGWPKWLRRLFKWWSEPVYGDFDKVIINSTQVKRNIEYTTKHEYISGESAYLGPSHGDLTKLSHGNMTTPRMLVEGDIGVPSILSETDKAYLKSKGVIYQISGIWYIKFSDGVIYPTNSNSKIEVVYRTTTEERPPYNNVARAQEINTYLSSNPGLYYNAFITLSDRINKRTGTLRKLCTIIESANINAQMAEQRKRNIANLFGYVNAYEITGGFGSKVATIKLASWEPYTSAYANLERMGTVYLLADNTEVKTLKASDIASMFNTPDIVTKGAEKIEKSFFSKNYVKTIITEIIDMVSDTQYTYELTKDLSIDNTKTYYVYDDQTMEYSEAEASDLNDENIGNLYERTGVSSGPVFNVTLQDEIPDSFRGRNPRLVKVY